MKFAVGIVSANIERLKYMKTLQTILKSDEIRATLHCKLSKSKILDSKVEGFDYSTD